MLFSRALEDREERKHEKRKNPLTDYGQHAPAELQERVGEDLISVAKVAKRFRKSGELVVLRHCLIERRRRERTLGKRTKK